jgi:tetratricopeptide (TPR) repeat protein
MSKMPVFIATVMLLASGDSMGDFAKTEKEEKLCRAAVYSYSDGRDKEDWKHMHHFCDCVRFTYRARRNWRNKEQYKYNLNNALSGCGYVLGHTSPGFYMRPLVLIQMGEVLTLQKHYGKAESALKQAISLNPKEAKAYVKLSTVYKRKKNLKGAAEILRQGLLQVPDSQLLKRRLERVERELKNEGSAG